MSFLQLEYILLDSSQYNEKQMDIWLNLQFKQFR